MRVLITALAPDRRPGAVPSAPVGRLLAGRLLEAGAVVRALVPRSEILAWPNEVDIVEGAVTDPLTTISAFDGVDRAFLGGLVSFEFTRMRELTNLLLEGPLSRVVVLSSHGSDFETDYSPETWQWLAFERALELRGATWTHLRPAGLFANAMCGGYPISGSNWMQSLAQGVPVREFLPDTAYPFIDETDLANIAATLILDDSSETFTGKLDVIGCLASARERISDLNAVLGADLRMEPLHTETEARSYWQSQGWPSDTIEITLYAMRAFQHANDDMQRVLHEEIAVATDLLGRPTRTFRDWLNDHSQC